MNNCLLFSLGVRLLPMSVFVIGLRSGTLGAVTEKYDARDAGNQESPVKNKMRCPGHVVEDATTGAGDLSPIVQHDQRDVASKYSHH